jgi:hypothetical protein
LAPLFLWTITTWVTLKKLIKKGGKKRKGFSSLKNVIHEQVFVQLKIIITIWIWMDISYFQFKYQNKTPKKKPWS